MRRGSLSRTIAAAAMLLSAGALAAAEGETVRVAVAANFASTLDRLAERFSADTGIEVRVSSGATGALYAQISEGAPFDLFLAADAERPRRLARRGQVAGDALRGYALGRLVLWQPSRPLKQPEALLADPTEHRIAIADPKLAPYGAAAKAVLSRFRAGDSIAGLRIGTNIAQAFQFVAAGGARAGLVALSQVRHYATARGRSLDGHVWGVPEAWYPPIVQCAVVLEAAAGRASARRLLDYLTGDAARSAIQQAGYGIPPAGACDGAGASAEPAS